MPKILMIAAEFPPCLSAGVQRTYHFAENLLRQGWQPLILSAHPRIYQKLDDNIVVSGEIKKHLRRAFAADASVHFAIKGKYLGFMENPDKMASWYPHGWRVGMAMVREHNPDVIWSTFPVSTAHRIALKLKLKTGKLWVADFRDPLHSHCEENYKNITERAKKIDAATLKHADLVVFATKSMRDLYHNAYPGVDGEKLCVIENGFDESVFGALKRSSGNNELFSLLYSGGIYQFGRDPIPLFQALTQLVQEGVIEKGRFKLKFRGAGDGKAYESIISELGLQHFIEFLPPVSYGQSIQEMKDADALLVLQGRIFNNQIPGKVYEYIAAGNPIIGMLGNNGATSKLLDTIPNAHVAEEKDVQGIKAAVTKVLQKPGQAAQDTAQYSRQSRGAEFVCRLNELLNAN